MSRRPVRTSVPGRPPGRRTESRRADVDTLRSVAAWVVERTLASRAPCDALLAGAASRFDERDQRLLREIVLGTLRWLRRIDDVLEQASDRPMEKVQPELHAVLRVAVFQLLFLDRVPAHAAVSEAVDEALARSHRGAGSFVNAVLRRIAREPRLQAWPVRETDPVRALAIESSHPDRLVRRWLDRLGEEATRELLDANNRPKAMHLLAFRDRGGRELLAERLIDEGIEVEPSRLSPLGLTVREGDPLATQAFARGDFYVQDEAGQAAALVPEPVAEELVLDAAAAPGGKGLALVAAEPSVRVVAADATVQRVDRLVDNLRRLRRSIPVVLADAARSPFAPRFDRVIVDYPCTGTGTLRKHPELKWRWSERELGRLADQAFALISGAAAAVAPGGILVAISCSLEPEENELVVERWLARAPEFERVEVALSPPPGSAASESLRGLWRIATADEHDGFTVQVVRRAR